MEPRLVDALAAAATAAATNDSTNARRRFTTELCTGGRRRRRRSPARPRWQEPRRARPVGDRPLPDRLCHRRGRGHGRRHRARLERPGDDRAGHRSGLRVRIRPDVRAVVPRRSLLRCDRPDRARRRHGVDHDHGSDRQRVRAARAWCHGSRTRRSAPRAAIAGGFVVAFPFAFLANRFLVARGRGHAVVHRYHH